MQKESALERKRIDQSALEIERRLMSEALTRLGYTTRPIEQRSSGRMIFGLDLTGSREPSLQHARIATTAMFDAIKAIGAVALKLVYYRGRNECRESRWHTDPAMLAQSMQQLTCECGRTQIGRLLRFALTEEGSIAAMVFVGDHCEEDTEKLVKLAEALRRKARPLFIFHECADHDEDSLEAKPVFRRMAETSGGVYVEFRPDSGVVLRELLANVAAFSVGGARGVERVALPSTPEAGQLQGRLLLGSGSKTKRLR